MCHRLPSERASHVHNRVLTNHNGMFVWSDRVRQVSSNLLSANRTERNVNIAW